MKDQISWPSRDVVDRITDVTVDIWAASLDVSQERLLRLAATLSSDEHERSRRFRTLALARQFIAGRGLLRELLSEYVHCPPGALRFEYASGGKPMMTSSLGESALQFNVSHSRDVALYAFSADVPVGVDVEAALPLADLVDLATSFSSLERARLAAVPSTSRAMAFYCCWTRKEALLKAQGTGLSARLDSCDVSVIPGEHAALLRGEDNPEASQRWSLVHLMPAPEYVGAVAVEAFNPVVRCAKWAR